MSEPVSPETRCQAMNAAGHKCCWELGHERNVNPELDKLLVWNGKAVHGWADPRGFREVWSATPPAAVKRGER